jgi:hypothetical protein
MSGSLGVYAERLAAQRELYSKLDLKQLENSRRTRRRLFFRQRTRAMERQPAHRPRDRA